MLRRYVGDVEIEIEGVLSDAIADRLFGVADSPSCAPNHRMRVETHVAKPIARSGGKRIMFADDFEFHTSPQGFEGTSDYASFEVLDQGRLLVVRVASDESTVLHRTCSLGGMASVSIGWRFFGRYFLHAASLRLPDGNDCLVVGESKSGKSSTLLALAAAGAHPFGDDAVFFGRASGGDAPEFFPVSRPVHVRQKTADAYAWVRDQGQIQDEGSERRWLVPLSAMWGGNPQLRALRSPVIVLPEIVDQPETSVTAAEADDAFERLFVSAIYAVVDGVPNVGQDVEILGSVVNCSRLLRLKLGRDGLEDPTVVWRKMGDFLRRGAP